MGGWILFRSETFGQAMTFYGAMTGLLSPDASTFSVQMFLTNKVITAIVLGAIFSWPVVPRLRELNKQRHQALDTPANHVFHAAYSGGKIILVLSLFLASLVSISSGAYNPFIYFRF